MEKKKTTAEKQRGGRDGRTGCLSVFKSTLRQVLAVLVVSISLFRPVPLQKSDREGGRASDPHFPSAASPLQSEILGSLAFSLLICLSSHVVILL